MSFLEEFAKVNFWNSVAKEVFLFATPIFLM